MFIAPFEEPARIPGQWPAHCRTVCGAMKLPFKRPCRNNPAIHLLSPMSVLRPETFRISCAFTKTTRTESSKYVMHRPPVNPRALHRHHRTIMLQQPLRQSPQVVRECAEHLDLALLLPVVVGENDTGRNAFLVNIHSATNGVHDPDDSATIPPSHGIPPD
jgi:hypothetical protein